MSSRKLVHFFQCQGHSEGLYNQNLITFTISSGLFTTKHGLIVQHLNPEFSVKKKKMITVFTVSAKIQNVSECLSLRYLLNYRAFCYQT